MFDSIRRTTSRLSYTLAEFTEATGLTRTAVYEAIANGTLRSFKHGRRRFVSAQAAQEWVRTQEQGGQRSKSRE